LKPKEPRLNSNIVHCLAGVWYSWMKPSAFSLVVRACTYKMDHMLLLLRYFRTFSPSSSSFPSTAKQSSMNDDRPPSPSRPQSPIKQAHSGVWKHFTKTADKGPRVCKYCSPHKQYAHDTSTGVLWSHIKSKHPEFAPQPLQPTLHQLMLAPL